MKNTPQKKKDIKEPRVKLVKEMKVSKSITQAQINYLLKFIEEARKKNNICLVMAYENDEGVRAVSFLKDVKKTTVREAVDRLVVDSGLIPKELMELYDDAR